MTRTYPTGKILTKIPLNTKSGKQNIYRPSENIGSLWIQSSLSQNIQIQDTKTLFLIRKFIMQNYNYVTKYMLISNIIYQCVKQTGKVQHGCHKCHGKYCIWKNIVIQ